MSLLFALASMACFFTSGILFGLFLEHPLPTRV